MSAEENSVKDILASADPKSCLDGIAEFFQKNQLLSRNGFTRSPNGLAGPEPTCKVIRAGGPFGGLRNAFGGLQNKVTLVTGAPLP
jgi:hypothetical protein